jgi:hypothetical protein
MNFPTSSSSSLDSTQTRSLLQYLPSNSQSSVFDNYNEDDKHIDYEDHQDEQDKDSNEYYNNNLNDNQYYNNNLNDNQYYNHNQYNNHNEEGKSSLVSSPIQSSSQLQNHSDIIIINDNLRNFLTQIDIGTIRYTNNETIKVQQVVRQLYPYYYLFNNSPIGTNQQSSRTYTTPDYLMMKSNIIIDILNIAYHYNNLMDLNQSGFINLDRIDPQVQAFTNVFVKNLFETFGKLSEIDRISHSSEIFNPLLFSFDRFLFILKHNSVNINVARAAQNNDASSIHQLDRSNIDLQMVRQLNLSSESLSNYDQDIDQSSTSLQRFNNITEPARVAGAVGTYTELPGTISSSLNSSPYLQPSAPVMSPSRFLSFSNDNSREASREASPQSLSRSMMIQSRSQSPVRFLPLR